MLTALAGGVGAAKFLNGLVAVVDPASITAIVNTADDDEFHGLMVSPDLDSVTYTLAGAQNVAQGWGLAGETFATMDALDRYAVPTWFRLGDRDIATHLFRTQALAAGAPLSEVTARIAAAWGLTTRLLPVTDDPLKTRITVRRADGREETLRMQEWFVKERSESPVVAVGFAGAEAATPGPGVLEAIAEAETVIICPSNPVISIGPILAVPGVREALIARRDRVVGISPIIAGAPVKGPADRLMDPLGIEVSCVGVARAYADFCSTLVAEVEAAGVRAIVADTLMTDSRIAAALARETLASVA
jgi:LPPG:FO 2-phospho-L-lactate transferase